MGLARGGSVVNPIVWKEFEADKLSILDILAIDMWTVDST
jgi:hypothetical protein